MLLCCLHNPPESCPCLVRPHHGQATLETFRPMVSLHLVLCSLASQPLPRGEAHLLRAGCSKLKACSSPFQTSLSTQNRAVKMTRRLGFSSILTHWSRSVAFLATG